MTRKDAIPYAGYVVDDAGCGRELGADLHAIVRESAYETRSRFKHASVLVGWQCGFEPMFVAVHSYLDVRLDDDEAEELARDFLVEKKWFSGDPKPADYIIR